MPPEPSTTPKPFGGFGFRNNKSFSESLSFISQAECAIISAERAGYTFEENAERTEALRVQLSDPFRGTKTLVFNCRLVDSRGMQPVDRLVRYLFVAQQYAFMNEPSDSAFLSELIQLSGPFNKKSLIFIPKMGADASSMAMNVVKSSEEEGGLMLNSLGSVSFDAVAERITIMGPEKRLVFEVKGTAPIIQPSMNTAYLFRTLKRRQFPGMPASDEYAQAPRKRPRQAARNRFS